MHTSPSKQWQLTLGLCAVAFAAVVAFACDDGADSSSPDDSLREARIDMSDAIAAAEREIGGGVTVEAEFELGSDGAAFEVEILVDGEVREVLVDPRDGRVLRVGSDPEDLQEAQATAERLANARLSLLDAIEIAERETGGTVFEVELDEQGFELAVLGEGGPVELLVSATDGSILAREQAARGPEVEGDEDDEDEDEDDED